MKKTTLRAFGAMALAAALASCSTTDFLTGLADDMNEAARQSSSNSSSSSGSASASVSSPAGGGQVAAGALSVSGSPRFDVPNVFFVGETAASHGLTVTAGGRDVSSSAVFASPSCVPGQATLSLTEGGTTMTGTVPGAYYVAAADALTRKPVGAGTAKVKRDGKEHQFAQYKFGDWPQTVVPTTARLTCSTEAVLNGWHLGSDGRFYERRVEKPYKSDYTYSNGTKMGSEERWFKVEPIVWRVLSQNYAGTGRALLHSEKALEGGIPFFPTRKMRTAGGKSVHANDWGRSTLRAFLNGTAADAEAKAQAYEGRGFLQRAFAGSALPLVAETKVANGPLKTGSKDASRYCADTGDRVFLLGFDEVYDGSLGFSEKNYGSAVNKNKIGDGNLRARTATDYARANGLSVSYGKCSWWLRSPQTDYTFDLAKDEEGSQAWVIDTIDNDTYARMADSAAYGIVPAITLKL